MRNARLITLAFCLGISAVAHSAIAAHHGTHAGISREETSTPATYQAGGVSLDQAVAMMQAKYGARVLRANTVEEDGRAVHYIRLITADRSRVWTVRVDAATGREF